jgi:hypothetical protein
MPPVTLPRKTGKFLRVFAPEFMATFAMGYSQAQADTIASKHELVIIFNDGMDGKVAGMKTAASGASPSHDVSVIQYVNGPFSPNVSTPASLAYAEDLYAHDVTDTGTGLTASRRYYKEYGTWLMYVRDPRWLTDRAANATSSYNQFTPTKCDGWWVDSLGVGAALGGDVHDKDNTLISAGTAAVKDPTTDATYDVAKWVQETTNLLAWIRGDVGRDGPDPLGVWTNGLGTGADYFASAKGPPSRLCSVSHGAMAEQFLRSPTAALSTWPSEDLWKQTVNMLIDAGNRGWVVMATTKIWVDHSHSAYGNGDGEHAYVNQFHKYAIGTFMLGSNGRQLFHFRHDWDSAVAANITGSDTDVGADSKERCTNGERWLTEANAVGWPTVFFTDTIGADGLSGGIVSARTVSGAGAYYRRDFTDGLVIVNPTASNTNAITLPAGTYLDLDGTSHSGSITAVARNGYVLRRQ